MLKKPRSSLLSTGRFIIHVATLADGRHWADLDEAAYREKKKELEEYLIDRLVEVIPDARERIEICETGTPRTMTRYTRNPLGTIYGYSSTVTSHSIHRPQPLTSTGITPDTLTRLQEFGAKQRG